MRVMGETPTRAEVQEMTQEFDTDKSDSLDFPEFLKCMERRARLKAKIDQYLDNFKLYDKDNNGTVSYAEARYISSKHPKL